MPMRQPRSMDKRAEAISEEFERRKLAEKGAHSVVEKLLEDHITQDVFLTSLKKITPQHYDDIVEERSLSDMCGYCLCRNKIKMVPQQQYKISGNRVFDITERKKFCSNRCFRLSQSIREQISTVPLWLRNFNDMPDIKIPVEHQSAISGEGEEIRLRHLVTKDDVEIPLSELETSGDVKHIFESHAMKPVPQKKKPTPKKEFRAPQSKQAQLPAKVSSISDDVFAVLKEWITPATREFLGLMAGQDKNEKTAEPPDEEVSLKQDMLEKQLNRLILGPEPQIKNSASKPVPDYKSLGDDVKRYEEKVSSFYGSSLQIKEKPPEETKQTESVTMGPTLPSIDSRNQIAIRQKIVLDKVKKMIDNLSVSIPNVGQELRLLIRSFRLTRTNVMLNTDLWPLLTICLLFLLGITNQCLQESLDLKDTTYILKSLLKPYNIEATHLQSVVLQIAHGEK